MTLLQQLNDRAQGWGGYSEEQTRALVRSAAAALERAQDHARKHVPSIQRIREAHTQMSAKAMEEWSAGPDKPGWGHRVYTQGQDEGCYLCALVIHAEAAEARVKRAERQLAEADAVVNFWVMQGGVGGRPALDEWGAEACQRHASRVGAPQPQTREEETRE